MWRLSKTELVMFLNESDAVSFSLLIKRDSETNNSIFKPEVENEDVRSVLILGT